MKKVTISLFLGIALTLIGCDRNPPKQLENAFVNDLNASLKEQQIRYYCLVNNLEFSSDTNQNPPVYRCIKPPTSSDLEKEQRNEAATGIRNDFIERSTLVIDANYEEFIAALGDTRSTGNFIADVIELSTSAVIGVIDNVNTLQILGVSLTAFRGTRSAFVLNFYEKQTTPILINTMDTGRNRVYQIILQKKGRSLDQYSLTEAMKDVVAYYNAGTLIRAFAELSKDAAIQSRISEEEVLELQGIQLSRPITQSPVVERKKKANQALFDLDVALQSSDSTKISKSAATIKTILSKIKEESDFKELSKKVGYDEDLFNRSLLITNPIQDANYLLDILENIMIAARDSSNRDFLNKIYDTIIMSIEN